MFDEIIAALGYEVAIADVKEKFPTMVGHVMRRGERVSRGVYRLTAGAESLPKRVEPKGAAESTVTIDTREEPEINMTSTRQIEVIDNIADENLIPDVNPSYVPWGCYSVVEKVVKSPIFAPVYIIGDSGNGKTFGVEQACAKAKRELIIMNITNETSEEDLIGSYILQDGNMIWKDGPVIAAMRRGAVLCLDEIDQARPAILALQTVAQNKPYFIKKTNELVRPRKGFTLIATANTKGNGDGMDKFSGAQILNEAFLERFSIIVEQDYPTEAVEKRILEKHTANKALIGRLAKFAKITRTAYKDGAVTHCLTTRRLVQICNNIEIFNDEKYGVELAVSRFNEENKQMFVELYDKLVKEDVAAAAAEAAKVAQSAVASAASPAATGRIKDPF